MPETSDQREQRLEKLTALRAAGVEPYPARFSCTHSVAQALHVFTSSEGSAESPVVRTAGRIMSIRVMGKASFAHIMDGSGRIQIYIRQDEVGEQAYEFFLKMFDLGDFIGVEGPLFRTRTGEITIRVQSFQMLAKALRPLPEKWHGLTDVELRYRQRYLDLLANERVRRTFITRTRIVSAIRRFLDERGFLEVETPILQPIYGGAAARPFVTHHNALDCDFYLRISDELYLKRLIIGGLERVYEIGRDFRNEGISTKHNPEFTQIEVYQAYADYHEMMRLTEELWSTVAHEVLGTTTITYQGHEINLTPPWRRWPMREAIKEATGIDIAIHTDLESLRQQIQERRLELDIKPTWGKQIEELFKEYVEPNLIQPTFILDYPLDISPLAKKKPDAPGLVERFEFFIGGLECGNAFSELNDPLEQRERFEMQWQQLQEGDAEAHPMDEDWIRAMEYGMPPTGGLGFGIDRMTMLFTDNPSIREVILFPALKPKSGE
ncbi:MAG: lysine--tRNA ligase [Chloroflexi bacterium]|nr:lysine--tRNA ligase [Chloroflexota bacterium]